MDWEWIDPQRSSSGSTWKKSKYSAWLFFFITFGLVGDLEVGERAAPAVVGRKVDDGRAGAVVDVGDDADHVARHRLPHVLAVVGRLALDAHPVARLEDGHLQRQVQVEARRRVADVAAHLQIARRIPAHSARLPLHLRRPSTTSFLRCNQENQDLQVHWFHVFARDAFIVSRSWKVRPRVTETSHNLRWNRAPAPWIRLENNKTQWKPPVINSNRF